MPLNLLSESKYMPTQQLPDNFGEQKAQNLTYFIYFSHVILFHICVILSEIFQLEIVIESVALLAFTLILAEAYQKYSHCVHFLYIFKSPFKLKDFCYILDGFQFIMVPLLFLSLRRQIASFLYILGNLYFVFRIIVNSRFIKFLSICLCNCYGMLIILRLQEFILIDWNYVLLPFTFGIVIEIFVIGYKVYLWVVTPSKRVKVLKLQIATFLLLSLSYGLNMVQLTCWAYFQQLNLQLCLYSLVFHCFLFFLSIMFCNQLAFVNSINKFDRKYSIWRLSQNWFSRKQVEFCQICVTEKANIVWLPCGHMLMCKDCAFKYLKISKLCICCKQKAIQFVQISAGQQERKQYQFHFNLENYLLPNQYILVNWWDIKK